MAQTLSTMAALGTHAPAFSLPDTSGRTVSLDDYAGQPLLVAFICNHCPFVKHIAPALAAFGREYQGKIGIVAINCNDVANYPDDSPAKMAEEVAIRGYTFPYLYDETQQVARAFKAACTPDFFLYDDEHKLVYRGQFDASRPGNGEPVTGADLRDAIDAVLTGGAPDPSQHPSIGCNIKWKPGNEPPAS